MTDNPTSIFYLGIDPGLVNTGWCLRSDTQAFTGVFSPRAQADTLVGISASSSSLFTLLKQQLPEGSVISHAAVERYVAYSGTMTKDAESILVYIGSLLYVLQESGIIVKTARAIDWKPAVCKELYKTKEFRNPSESFDKKYSLAAAKCIQETGKITHHEADAVCLSYYAQITK